MDKFKVGDKVKLVSMKNEDSFYKKYLGKIFTIKQVGCVAVTFKEATEENISPYYYNLQKVEEEYTYENLKKSPIGTKITFENGAILIKTEKNRFENGTNVTETRFINNHFEDKFCGKIIKIEEPTYTTVYEHKEEILDEAEKRYLRSVIKPFRDRVTFISKLHTREDKEFISINLKNGDYIDLPLFKENTMYKKMIINKDYTLKELGL